MSDPYYAVREQVGGGMLMVLGRGRHQDQASDHITRRISTGSTPERMRVLCNTADLSFASLDDLRELLMHDAGLNAVWQLGRQSGYQERADREDDREREATRLEAERRANYVDRVTPSSATPGSDWLAKSMAEALNKTTGQQIIDAGIRRAMRGPFGPGHVAMDGMVEIPTPAACGALGATGPGWSRGKGCQARGAHTMHWVRRPGVNGQYHEWPNVEPTAPRNQRNIDALKPPAERYTDQISSMVHEAIKAQVKAAEAALVEQACEVMYDAREAKVVEQLSSHGHVAAAKSWADVGEQDKVVMRAGVIALATWLGAGQ